MDQFTQFDGNLLIGIQQALNADWLTPVMKFFSLLAEDGIFLILVCLVMMIFRRTRRAGIICTLALAFTFVCCNLILKPLVDRDRPWEVFNMVNVMLPVLGDGSFPSGHSANSMATAWALFMTSRPVRTDKGRSYDEVRCLGWDGEGVSPKVTHRISVIAVAVAVLVGVSRIYLGMHYPSDVACGLLLGMLTATVTYKVILRVEDSRGLIGSVTRQNRDE